MYHFSFFHTFVLLSPYVALIIYFLLYQHQSFFLKTRSSVQLLFVLIFLTFVLLQIFGWNSILEEVKFLKFSIDDSSDPQSNKSKSLALVALIAALLTTFGWVFTSRVQIINAIKGHTMQVLMNSRTSTAYAQKVDDAMKLKKALEAELSKPNPKVELTPERYAKLTDIERSAVHYLLNFLEFVALGIRHYTLDEELMKGSLRSILNSNYRLFYPVIQHLRKIDNTNVYTQLEILYKRWDETHNEKCEKCDAWQAFEVDNQSFRFKYRVHILIVATLLTCGAWLVIELVMLILRKLTVEHKPIQKFICKPCIDTNN